MTNLNRPAPLTDDATDADIEAYCAWRDENPRDYEIVASNSIENIPVADRGNIPAEAITGHDYNGVAILSDEYTREYNDE